jgi:dGTPase
MIAEMFQLFVDEPERLPDYHRELSEMGPIHRVVCDYIAGMTDGFLHRTYEQMFGQRVPSLS